MRRVKMHLKCAEIFVLLCVFHGTSQETIDEGKRHTITCKTKHDLSLTVMWIRATGERKVEFIVSYKNKRHIWGEKFGQTMETSDGYTLTIKSFHKKTDSGIYNCATYNANELKFGQLAFDLQGEADIKPTPPKTTKTPKMTTNCTAAAAAASTPCVCPNRKGVKGNPDLEKSCELLIWAPLAAGCGVLFILLIAVSLYCNKIRTRRCPHHHKRKPRAAGGMHHPGPNRYV